MSLRFCQIEVFRCLMHEGTATRAALALSISQPAVSRHIADLEANVGLTLFNRIKGRLEPTESAIQLATVVEQNFLGLDRIEFAAKSLRDGVPRPVSVACLPALSTSLMPDVAARVRSGNRRFGLHVDTGTVPTIIERLRTHVVDLALTLTFPDTLGIEADQLFTVDHVCAVPENHPLAKKTTVTPEDFAGHAVIGWSAAGPLSFNVEEAVFDDYIDDRNIVVTTHTSHTRYAMVAAGVGITIAEPFSAHPWTNQGVAIRAFRPRLPLSYSLCHATGRVHAETVGIVKDAIIETVVDWQQRSAGSANLQLISDFDDKFRRRR